MRKRGLECEEKLTAQRTKRRMAMALCPTHLSRQRTDCNKFDELQRGTLLAAFDWKHEDEEVLQIMKIYQEFIYVNMSKHCVTPEGGKDEEGTDYCCHCGSFVFA
jgi:hypothetical protein